MANCVHGFPQGDCLICKTLGVAGPGKTGAVQAKTKVAGGKQATALLADDDLGRALPATRAQNVPNTNAETRQRKPRGMRSLLGLVAVIAVGGLAILAFGRIFDLAFHIFEYAAIALVAGWIGYKAGHAAGRHERDHER